MLYDEKGGKRMKLKRFTSIIISLFTTIASVGMCFAQETISTENLTATTDIKLGDYVKLGNFHNEDIVWRCVSFEKIVGYDNEGNPITDATQTSDEYKEGYLPLMFSDKIIDIKMYDAAGTNLSGSHIRGAENQSYGALTYYNIGNNKVSDIFNEYSDETGTYYKLKPEYYTKYLGRPNHGSPYWGDSNIRDWLNSNNSAGMINWSCGNPPKYIKPSPNYPDFSKLDYDNEQGFLRYFSDKEKNIIKKVSHRVHLSEDEYIDLRFKNSLGYENHIDCHTNSGFSDYCQYEFGYETFEKIAGYEHNKGINDAVKDYDSLPCEYFADKMFLIDKMQLCNIYNNFGEDFSRGEVARYLITDEKYHLESYHDAHPDIDLENINDKKEISRLLNISGYYIACFEDNRCENDNWINSQAVSVSIHNGYYPNYPKLGSWTGVKRPDGIRPAFYMDFKQVEINSGDGSKENPFVLNSLENEEDTNNASFVVDAEKGALTGCNSDSEIVAIPDVIDGVEIKAISAGAFKNSNVKYVKLPDGVEVIEEGAFESDVAFFCNIASKAEEFLKVKGIAYSLVGDADDDKVYSATDAEIILANVLNSNDVSAFKGNGQKAVYFIDNSDKPDATTAAKVLAKALNIEFKF